jgi:lipoprotein-anchoring transpeptidase ErfK/SrfK
VLHRFERTTVSQDKSSRGDYPPPAVSSGPGGRRRPRLLLAPLMLLVLAVLALGALALMWSRASLVADSSALARVDLPLSGGTIESVSATNSRGRPIPIALHGERLWPQVTLAAGEPIAIEVLVRRPGWIAWLAGGEERERLTLRTPSTALREHYLTLPPGAPLRLAFDEPVRVLAYGQQEHLHRRTLTRASSQSRVYLAGRLQAGTIEVAAAPRTWERLPAPVLVSWFPPGAGTSAVASPPPGARISPSTPISLTFSKPVAAALGRTGPRLQPAVSGRWRTVGSHTLMFMPSGYGYGLGTSVSVGLPSTVRLIGGQGTSSSSVAQWTVPDGSSLRAQQILAQLGYLPLSFSPSGGGVRPTAAAQERAAINPPMGSFSWRYGDIPASLRQFWAPGQDTVVMRGALMAFEEAHGLTTDGLLGPQVWRTLIDAALAGQRATAGYTYVMVSESSQSLALWHDGSVRLTTPVNTGIASAPTALGTYPVYEHIASGTMSGTNPDGSHYKDPGIPWISYFNGGDALHGFDRASYGVPQSLGCVEMPPATAGEVWPYTPVGTLVHIE